MLWTCHCSLLKTTYSTISKESKESGLQFKDAMGYQMVTSTQPNNSFEYNKIFEILPNMIVSKFHKKLYLIKVDVPNPVSNLKQTPIFEWCTVACESKNGHLKNIS